MLVIKPRSANAFPIIPTPENHGGTLSRTSQSLYSSLVNSGFTCRAEYTKSLLVGSKKGKGCTSLDTTQEVYSHTTRLFYRFWKALCP